MILLGLITHFLLLVLNIGSYNTQHFFYSIEPGPKVIPTKGQVWPKPQQIDTGSTYFQVNPEIFKFTPVNHQCDILIKAIQRYKNMINKEHHRYQYDKKSENLIEDNEDMYLKWLNIDLQSPCEEWPHVDMDEHYDLIISSTDNKENATLTSNSIWGILRGLETFSQLLYTENEKIIINETHISDYPRFKHRGLLLDTSRHYVPLYLIFKTLKSMSYNKFNVFHWHIVDDQSFPYESIQFPTLSLKGAYHPSLIYSQKDIQRVIKFARLLGIRVIPEFDSPGHTRSWGEAYPDLLTRCYQNDVPTKFFGPLDPTKNATYKFLEDLYKEIVQVFPDEYVHLGGDEVDLGCWESNPDIKEFMEAKNITNYIMLEGLFLEKLYSISKSLLIKTIVWEELFTLGINVSKDTIIQVWTDSYFLNSVTKQNYTGLLSAGYYLDHIKSGEDWTKYYENEPYHFVDTVEQRNYILGGEACMWGEFVDNSNLLSRIWPRASAIAEKLWSAQQNVSLEISRRLEEHACRLKKRGIPAQPPNGPGFCI